MSFERLKTPLGPLGFLDSRPGFYIYSIPDYSLWEEQESHESSDSVYRTISFLRWILHEIKSKRSRYRECRSCRSWWSSTCGMLFFQECSPFSWLKVRYTSHLIITVSFRFRLQTILPLNPKHPKHLKLLFSWVSEGRITAVLQAISNEPFSHPLNLQRCEYSPLTRVSRRA